MRLLLAFLLVLPLPGADYDWLFRNARVVDGSGNPWYHSDVATKDGKIAVIGNLINADADRIVDAAGRVLAPGFIDVHTHIEQTILKVPNGDNFLLDGVTTVVTGNCGGSKLELGAFFEALEEEGLGLNVASLIGQGTVRAKVMGDAEREPTPEEMDAMKALVGAAMEEGAVGLSTGLIYVPGSFAKTEEVIELARVASERGGVYATHIRHEGSGLMEALAEAIRIGHEADIPVEVSHFKVAAKQYWGRSGDAIAMVEKARQDGLDIVVDQYPYDRSSTSIGVLLPEWSRAGGAEEIKKRLRDTETRVRIAGEMEELVKKEGFEDYSFATVAGFEPDRSLEGKTITEINRSRGRTATIANEILTVMEIMNQGGAQMIYHKMSMADVEQILRYPNTAVASDGGTRVFGLGKPHPRSYGTNARVLREFVRERGVLTLEDAVRRMTSLPARTFGFRDRGMIREGMAADLLLFDTGEVSDGATFQNPHQYSKGFGLVLVNGTPVVEDGKLTGRRPGKILRHIDHDPVD